MGRKIISLSVIALFASTLTFAGCGKKEEPPPPPPPAPVEPAPAPAPAPDAAAPAGGEQKAGEPAKDAPMEKGMEKKEEGKTK